MIKREALDSVYCLNGGLADIGYPSNSCPCVIIIFTSTDTALHLSITRRPPVLMHCNLKSANSSFALKVPFKSPVDNLHCTMAVCCFREM